MARRKIAVHLANQKTDKYGRSQVVTRSAGVPYSGDANAGNIGVGAEIYLGGQGWVDISSDIYYRDGSTQVQISRGRPNESASSLPPPQSCTFQLNNRLNKYSPRNPLGQYYGLIGRNTPIRFWRMQNGVRRYRYAGEIPSWPTTADISGNDVFTSVQAAGLLRRLSQGTPPVQSAMYRSMVNPLSTGKGNIVAYWPLEDGSSATQFASGLSGGAAMTTVQTGIVPAGDSSWQASKALPVIHTGTISGTVPSYTDTGETHLRVQLIVPAAGIPGPFGSGDIVTLYTTGSIRRIVYNLDTAGELALAMYNYNNDVSLATGYGAPMPTGLNGKNITLGLKLQQSGTNILWTVYTLDEGASSYASGVLEFDDGPDTLPNNTVGVVTAVKIGGGFGGFGGVTSDLGQLAMGHCAVGNRLNAFGAANLALIANSGEPVFSPDALVAGGQSTGRFLRLCQEQNINGVEQYGSVYSGDVVTMGAQTPDTFVNWLQQCADSGLNLLYETRDQVAMALRSRLSLYNQSAKLTLDYSQNQLAAQLQPQDDDAFTRNDVTVTRTSGSSTTQILDDGSALSVSNPPTGSGDYSTSVSLSLGADTQTNDQAGWRVHMGTVDEPRYPKVSINLRHETFQNNLDLMNAALTLDIGDVIEIDNPPTWISYDPIRLVVLGYQETMGAFEHSITFNCTPESPYRIAILDDPILARADLDGSTLSSNLSTILNGNPFMAGGSSVGWSPFGGSMALIGTSGSSNPLPSGGPTGYGLLFTADGTSFANLFEGAAANTSFSVVPGQTYYVSALVYYPSALNQVFVSVNFYDSGFSFIPGTNTPFTVPANTWTAISSSFVAPANAAFGAPAVGLSGATSNGDTLYATNVVCWSGSMSVATDPTGPLWTTDTAQFPFDIRVSGERMTVTGITGSSSPQTFTVARSINTVAKAQNAGASVNLWQPMILSL